MKLIARRFLIFLNMFRWRGHVMRLQQAKESFMDRLAKERQQKVDKFQATTQKDLNYDPLQMMRERDAREGG